MANFFPFLILAFPIILSFTHGEKNNEIRNVDEVPNGGRVTPIYTVHIIDGLASSGPPELTFRCKSGDDDLGLQSPVPGQDYNFTFRESIFGSTLFFCTFNLGDQRQSFDVFNKGIRKQCKQCFWLVKEDGFSFSNDNFHYEKKYNWL
ncbi:S-protein homolog 5-like [Actinidia eriantha]|uniref:S-protein homolog 5-like n=1 Tax=Actinidia eriantha TaxID=165200 RepID=UPI00258FE590|nr:S-protein homolog 5-like [Actinidia eriantha]